MISNANKEKLFMYKALREKIKKQVEVRLFQQMQFMLAYFRSLIIIIIIIICLLF